MNNYLSETAFIIDHKPGNMPVPTVIDPKNFIREGRNIIKAK